MLPRFGENQFSSYRTNRTNEVLTLSNAEKEALFSYRSLFLEEGYREVEAYEEEQLFFSALSLGREGVFLCYFPRIRELTIVKEEDCAYFERTNPVLPAVTSPAVTQIHLTDFGLSYVIRLSDGRFVILDGGWDTPEDQKSLADCLAAQSETEVPCIACWILTHPHGDHHRLFNAFWKEFEGKIALESILLHFPEEDDVTLYPKLSDQKRGKTNGEEIRSNFRIAKKLGAKIYTAHTGQTYRFGDARFRILLTMENTVGVSGNINAISLVMKMELGGQSVLWTGDAYCKPARLAERYGEGLKSDILQVFHHGFSSGSPSFVIDAYREIMPRVCLLPTTDVLAFSTFGIHQRATRHLFEMECVREVITGEETRTIPLPYQPDPSSKAILQNKMREGLEACGQTRWEISCGEKTEYTLRNITFSEATVTLRQIDASGGEKEVELTVPKRGTLAFSALSDAKALSFISNVPLWLE